MRGRSEAVGEEPEIFEGAEQAEIHDQTGGQEQPPRALASGALERETDQEVGGGAQRDQTEEAPVPPAVEQVAGGDQECVLGAHTAASEPVQHEDDRQEDGEGVRGEEQGLALGPGDPHTRVAQVAGDR